jgi:hypothetical protein
MGVRVSLLSILRRGNCKARKEGLVHCPDAQEQLHAHHGQARPEGAKQQRRVSEMSKMVEGAPALLAKLKKEYADAMRDKKESFMFDTGDGETELLAAYARYLIDFLETRWGMK